MVTTRSKAENFEHAVVNPGGLAEAEGAEGGLRHLIQVGCRSPREIFGECIYSAPTAPEVPMAGARAFSAAPSSFCFPDQ